jgi:aerobic C4-dicarboxylate transport protein
MRRFFGKLYVQVLIGVFAGVALGFYYPSLGVDVKPHGDVFIKRIKMVFAPIIFAMVVLGIARMENMKELGRVGARALIYFEVLSTFALGLGLLAVNLVGPGVGMNVDPATLDTKAIANYTAASTKPAGFVDFLLNMVPTSIVDALAKNDILQTCRSSSSPRCSASRCRTSVRAPSRWSRCWTRSSMASSRSSA